MMQMYYKIPPRFVEELGLATTLIKSPDGNFYVSRVVMSRIDPDIDRALEITGGIALDLDQVRDDQRGIASYPLPGSAAEAADGNRESFGSQGSLADSLGGSQGSHDGSLALAEGEEGGEG